MSNFSPLRLYIDNFTPSVNLVNRETELLERIVDRGFVEAILPSKPFNGLFYGYETVTYSGAAGTKTLTLADTLGVADNPHLGDATTATDEIYVYASTLTTTLDTAMVQDADGTAAPAAGHFALSADRKSVKIGYDGAKTEIKVFYLLSSGILKLKVTQPDKSVKRSLFTWKMKQLNEHDYVNNDQKILMPNGWILDEKFVWAFYVDTPTVVKTEATTYTDATFTPTKITVASSSAQKRLLGNSEKATIASYTKLLR